uniref:Vesicle-fusing ATPase n=1 Tax=Micromonas pusilla TaxID=38833 RepID=A0A7S0PMG8_MICPS
MDSATQEREAGLLQLLVELDGFDTKANAGGDQEMVLVMGATNLSAQLDPALLRSGRFERSFHIGVPKRHQDRVAILQVHAKKLNIPREGDHKWESDALLNRTAELTDGYSGASLAALLNEASILSVRADREFVNLSDVERVIERNLVGVSSAPLEDGWGKDHMAMVEAGRAVLWSSKRSMNYCPEILRVTIKPAGEQATGIMLKPERSDENSTTHFNGEERPDTFDDFIDGIAMLIAGRCVETVFYGPQGISVQTKGDLVSAADIAYEIVTGSGLYPHQGAGLSPMWPEELIEHFRIPRTEMDVGVYDMMVRAHIRAEEYINYYKPVILQVASELLAHGSLYGSYIRELVEEHEIAMKLAKDEELARADERATEEEERARKDALHEQELEARRQAAAAAAAEQAAAAKEVEEDGKGSAIDVESSDEPLSSDPFGTAASDAGEYKDQLSRALRFVSLSGDKYRRSEYPEDFPPSMEADVDADMDADAAAGRLARALRDVRLSGAAFMTAAEVEEVVERVAPAAEEILFVDDGEYREMLRRALRDVRLSGGSTMTAAEVSEVVKKIDPDTVAYREQYKAELINMMKQKEAEKKAEDENKKGNDDEGDDRVSRALRT